MSQYTVIIGIEKKDAFMQSPPAGWRMDSSTGKMRCEDNSVNVLVDDKKFHGSSTAIDINSMLDIDQAKQMLFSKPLVMTVLCGKSYSQDTGRRNEEAGRDNTAVVHNEEYVAIINTQHPQVQEMITNALNRAQQFLNERKKFRVMVSFSESVKAWFTQNVHMPNESNNTAYATHADIYFVNGVGEPGFADRCFSCEAITQKCFWCVCFPFFFLCFLPYMIYKKCILGVVEEKYRQQFAVTFHNGPFQMGFNLLNLLYPPGTVLTTISTYNQPVQQQPYAQQQPGGPYQQPQQQYYQQQPPQQLYPNPR